MAELCIVCLGELRSSLVEDPPPALPDDAAADLHDETTHSIPEPVPRATAATAKTIKSSTIHSDEEAIAHLLPCKHDLHNACLKPWVERANSCPICRATFNMVELSHSIGGSVIDSYAVADKVQEAELDPTMVMEEELFASEAWEPCLICGSAEDVHEIMYCDGCDKAVHVFCAGFEDSPDVWYCERCLVDLENDVGLPGMASAMRRGRRGRPATATTRQRRSRRSNNPDAVWARVWQEVSRRLDLDLDFPFDDEPQDHRTEEQRREFARWQRRFEVANRQGASNRLREIASTQIRNSEPTPLDPESQEELRAWNAFEKARESQDAPASVRRRKRKATASPAPSGENEAEQRPQQKRPRLRRPRPTQQQQSREENPQQPPQPIAESSNAAAQRTGNGAGTGTGTGEGPTFLSSLLREVESKPASASSPGASEQHTGQFSPGSGGEMSPMLSPSSSACGTPRALSPSRPLSPPLSSSLIPTSPPSAASATFSPFSPVVFSQASPSHQQQQQQQHHHRHRGRSRKNNLPATDDRSHSGDEQNPATASAAAFAAASKANSPRASSLSPSRLSYSAKEELQRMVKLALGSRYRDREISKDQYTAINREVSRKLYELVGDASQLAGEREREKWQGVADEEVRRAVGRLGSAASDDDGGSGDGDVGDDEAAA